MTEEWLLDGDPAIRWHVGRDLLDHEGAAERRRIATEGWGARIMAERGRDGHWPNARWTGTVWTLINLVELGFPPDDPRLSNGFELVAGRLCPAGKTPKRDDLVERMDLCHLGFWMRIGGYFSPRDPRLSTIAEVVLSLQMKDGGWNCRIRNRPHTIHSSFHTTFNVLEGLRELARSGVLDATVFATAEVRALEFMLDHRLYRSDKTGEVINERFLELTYPTYWHYNVLRALDYLRESSFINDPRLDDPIERILKRRKPNGRWPVEKRIPGVTLFDMEKMGQDSRWNTLRALRVMRARG